MGWKGGGNRGAQVWVSSEAAARSLLGTGLGLAGLIVGAVDGLWVNLWGLCAGLAGVKPGLRRGLGQNFRTQPPMWVNFGGGGCCLVSLFGNLLLFCFLGLLRAGWPRSFRVFFLSLILLVLG